MQFPAAQIVPRGRYGTGLLNEAIVIDHEGLRITHVI